MKRFIDWTEDHDFNLHFEDNKLAGIPKDRIRHYPREYLEVIEEGGKKPEMTLTFQAGMLDHMRNNMYAHMGWYDRVVFYHNDLNGAYSEHVFEQTE